MLGSDVVVMWVDDNGSVRAQDSYITDRAAGIENSESGSICVNEASLNMLTSVYSFCVFSRESVYPFTPFKCLFVYVHHLCMCGIAI